MEGWIKLHRKILDNPIVCKDNDTLAIWIYLLLNATHQDIPALFKGKKITLKKGQLITGILSIANNLSINKDKVQRTLKLFESDKQIEQQTSNKNRLISILNWDKYQEIDNQNDKQMINKCETDDKQMITNKNERIKEIYIYGQTTGQENIFDNVDVELEEIKKQKWKIQFDEFYNAYPRKVKKQDVKKWFEKNKPSNELFSSMMNSLEQFRASKDWQKDGGQYIPYPSTWLNQKRWEDEEVKPETKIQEIQKSDGGRQTC